MGFMKKLMFMTNALYGGGAEKILQNIISNLDYRKYKVTLYSLHKENIDHELYKGNFEYKSVFNNSNSLARKMKGWLFNHCSARLFYLLFIHEKSDVAVAFIEGESSKIISGSSGRDTKKLAWVHTDLEQNPWTAFLYKGVEDEKKHYEKFDHILCVSDSVKESFIKKFDVNPNKVKTQYNPIDEQAILNKTMEQCELPSKKRLRMIAVGRLVVEKGFDRLLHIVYRIKSEGLDFELYILGEGEEKENLQNYVAQHGLRENVYLLGFQQNPYPFMKDSDLLVCSSRAEGFSTVLSEGIVLGVPIVSTDCAGVRELFGDEECGIITENTEAALYKALKSVIESPEALKVFREAVVRRGQGFSLEKSMIELEKIFDA